jgi:N-formylmaleamate deformylase
MRIASALVLLLAACGGAPAAPAAPPFTPTSFRVSVTGAGRPVIFIPGLGCDGTIWNETVAHLGGKVQAHVLSLAGFAGAPPIAEPLLPTVHDELLRYIAANRLDHPILVGHSLGGFLTYWTAETAPDVLGGAVVVDGAPYLPALRDPSVTPDKVKAEVADFAGHLAAMTPETFAPSITNFLGQMISKTEDKAQVGAMASKSDPKTTGDAISFMFMTDLRPDLRKIKTRVLVLAADTNGLVDRDTLEKAWRAQVDPIPRHELVIVEHAKHFIMLDQPAVLDAALDKFLAAK